MYYIAFMHLNRFGCVSWFMQHATSLFIYVLDIAKIVLL